MKTSSTKKVIKLVQISLLVALVVVLQIVSAVIPPIAGLVSITLTLVPVVVGGILLGKASGALLGFAFGVIVLINCITGMDPGGSILWNANPIFTALICFVKGTAAGFFPALLYELCGGRNPSQGRIFVSTLAAALSAPVINTGLFVLGMLLLFKDILYSWAGETDVITYILVGLAGVNFLVEFAINIILSPAIVRISAVVGRKLKK